MNMDNEALKRYVVSGDDIQVGDIVRIKPYTDDMQSPHVHYASDMHAFAGKTYKVLRVTERRVYLEYNSWTWMPHWLERV